MKFFLTFLVFCCFLISCAVDSDLAIKEIKIGLHNNNRLKIELNIFTNATSNAYVEYWVKGDSSRRFKSQISSRADTHRFVLTNIQPKTNYFYAIHFGKENLNKTSKTYAFTSEDLPEFLKNQFKAALSSDAILGNNFKNGYILVNKRYSPGAAYLTDYKGRLRWYHTVDDFGFKVIHFTKDKTMLSILGSNDEPTSYGSQILEINMLGDTILHLKKGQGDFKQTVHHEILKNSGGQIVTLVLDQRVFDLSKVGGSKKDTVSGDGILVMDKKGNVVWKWSVFDHLDPLKDKNILKIRKDWVHANSLNFDVDGNYLISFYNTGEIWKVDSKTGEVYWKFGKNGTIKTATGEIFSESHAVHINTEGDLMLFDNGLKKKLSGVYAFNLDTLKKVATTKLHFTLPQPIYNDRMGSAYLLDSDHFLICASKRHMVILTNRKGTLLWTLETSMPSYRAIFLKGEQVAPYIEALPNGAKTVKADQK
ncbi:arylsulfate sulfotransferase [Pedobacter sp. UYEF25]